jgi:hypothetical protein
MDAAMSRNTLVADYPLDLGGSLKPALASIEAGRSYMGKPSRGKFYADILPLLETVKFGRRNFIVVASMDRLIDARRKPALTDSAMADYGDVEKPAQSVAPQPVSTPADRTGVRWNDPLDL